MSQLGCLFVVLNATSNLSISVRIEPLKELFAVYDSLFKELPYFVETLSIIPVCTFLIVFNGLVDVLGDELAIFIN